MSSRRTTKPPFGETWPSLRICSASASAVSSVATCPTSTRHTGGCPHHAGPAARCTVAKLPSPSECSRPLRGRRMPPTCTANCAGADETAGRGAVTDGTGTGGAATGGAGAGGAVEGMGGPDGSRRRPRKWSGRGRRRDHRPSWDHRDLDLGYSRPDHVDRAGSRVR